MKKPKVENLSEEILRKNMERKRTERAEKCTEEIRAVLKKHNCDIFAAFQLSSDTVIHANTLIKLPELWAVNAL